MSILSVIVYYHPDGDVKARFQSIFSQSDFCILYNNGDIGEIDSLKNELGERDLKKILVYENGKNNGIGAALSFSRKYALEHGFDYLATFDQDSSIPNDFVHNLLNGFSIDSRIALLAPMYKDINSGEFSQFPIRLKPFGIKRARVSTESSQLVDVYCCITSGSIYKVSCFEEIGDFLEHYFIDYIDNEYCLRILSKNFRVCIDPKIVIEHALGRRETRKKFFLKATPTNYSPFRKYHMSRNRVDMYKKYFFPFPLFVCYDFVAFIMDFSRISLFEVDRKRKIKAIFIGLWDGLKGNFKVGHK